MKKTILLILCLFSFLIGQAQVSKTVNLIASGSLYYVLTDNELNTVTNLTITGPIDDRDILTMRDDMPVLSVIDLSGATILGNKIPNDAFYYENTDMGKKSLTSIIIPSTVTSIGYNAFAVCRNLTSFTIPNSVTSIGFSAFAACSGLSSISIPSSVNSIGEDAFMGSGYIIVDKNNPNYSSKDGVLFNKNQTLLIQCPISKKGSYVIPSSVDTIDCDVFAMCSGLTSITIPSSVTLIFADLLFWGCINITSIYAYSSTPIDIWSYYDWEDINTSSCILYVPKGSLSLYQTTDPWKKFTHIVEFTPTAVNDTPISTIKVRVQNGQLIITGLNENDMVAIYTLQGIPIIRQKAQSETMALSLPAHGVYIVQTGTQSVKVVY